jgi:hypothetical protein
MLWNAEFDQNYEKTLSQKFFFYKLSADVAREQNHRMINLREGEKPKTFVNLAARLHQIVIY